MLIDMGASFDHADTKAQRPIYYAIHQNHFEMVKFLIDKGANLHTVDKKGLAPTHWAKKSNKPEILSLLLESGGVLSTDQRRPKGDNRRPVKEA
jgi:ankyrin repeat protein